MSGKVVKIDSVNFIVKTVEFPNGLVREMGSISVRALRSALASVDQDAMVIYLDEICVPETDKSAVLYASAVGVLETTNGIVYILGPTSSERIKRLATKEPS